MFKTFKPFKQFKAFFGLCVLCVSAVSLSGCLTPWNVGARHALPLLAAPEDHGADKGRGRDEITIQKRADDRRSRIEDRKTPSSILHPPSSTLSHKTEWTIEKYSDDDAFRKRRPFEVSHIDGNLMLNEGINEMLLLVAGAGGTAYNNANARCGVGDSAAAEAATQTDLQAVTNKLYKAQNATFPTTGSQQIVFKCDYTGAEANFLWTEFTVDNGATPLKNLNRKVSAQGTKTSGQTWTLTLTITLS